MLKFLRARLTDDSSESLRPLVMRLWREHVRPYWPRLVLIMVFIALVAGSTALYPVIINWAYDALAERNPWILSTLPILVIGTTSLKGLALYLQVRFTNDTISRIETDLQRRLYDHLLGADVSQISRDSPAALTQRFTTDIGYVRDALTRVITTLVRDMLTVFGLFCAMVYLDWQLSLIAFLVAPAAAIPVQRIGKRVRRVATTTQEQIGLMATLISESFGAARMVKAYKLEPYLHDRANTVFEEVRDLKVKAAEQKGRLEPILEALGGLAVTGVLLVIGWRIISGNSSVGEFTGFVSAILIAAQPMRSLGSLNVALQEASSALVRVYTRLDENPHVVDAPDAKPLAIRAGAVSFRDVTFRYPDGTEGLSGTTIEAEGGKVTAIVGRSGAGKSTLLGLLPRLYDVTEGAVLVDEQETRSVTLSTLRGAIAVVSQDVVMFNDTVAANIALGKPGASREEIEAAARSAHAHAFITRLPKGYDTVLGDRGTRLSGGERQRVALARAFLKDAPILLLDEATSALDAESESIIQKALADLQVGRTTLVIAHRLATIRAADKIVVMDRGKVVESGTHDTLLAADGVYAMLYRLQFREHETIADRDF
ncbi:ABC transporter ATP-binding protein [Segnochrobactraceae bacterium EtOH-i3]